MGKNRQKIIIEKNNGSEGWRGGESRKGRLEIRNKIICLFCCCCFFSHFRAKTKVKIKKILN